MSEHDELFKQVLSEAKGRRPVFEDALEAIYSAILKPGDAVVDGGAHKGRHTYPCARLVGPSGIVHAYEVLPPLVEAMSTTLQRNELSQVRLHPEALTRNAGHKLPFKWVKNAWGHSGLRDRDHGALVPEIEELVVQTTTVDSLREEEIRKFRYIKLDLEGGEFDAMVGARAHLGRWKPLITFENSRQMAAAEYNYSSDEFFAFFREMNYALFDAFGRVFDKADWGKSGLPWDFVAASRQEDRDFMTQNIVDIYRRLMLPS